MVGATVLGVFLQGLPPDRRVAMARVASLIRRAARGVRESKRFGLVFYELNGGPLFGLESREKSLTLYIAERSVIEPFLSTMKGIDAEHSLIEFTDLNRLPLPDIEKIVRASVVARRERQAAPSQSEILAMCAAPKLRKPRQLKFDNAKRCNNSVAKQKRPVSGVFAFSNLP